MNDVNHPKVDMFGTTIYEKDSYYIMPDESIVDVINVDEYFVQVLKAELVKGYERD